MITKISIFIVLLSVIIAYIKFASTFVKYCEFHLAESNNQNSQFLNSAEKAARMLEMNTLCVNYYRDYSQHPLMSKTIKKLNKVLEDQDSDDLEDLMNYIEKYDKSNIKLVFLGLGGVNFGIYSMVLYFTFVLLPEIILSILSGVFKKVLFLAFGLMVVEALLKVYFNVEFNIYSYLELAVQFVPFQRMQGYGREVFMYLVGFLEHNN